LLLDLEGEVFDEEELADGGEDGGEELADEVGHAELGDEQEHQQLAEAVADEVDNEKRQEALPYFVLDLEVVVPVEEETGYHGHLIADSVGQQLVHVAIAQQGEDAHVNGGGKDTYDTVEDKVAVLLVLFVKEVMSFAHEFFFVVGFAYMFMSLPRPSATPSFRRGIFKVSPAVLRFPHGECGGTYRRAARGLPGSWRRAG